MSEHHATSRVWQNRLDHLQKKLTASQSTWWLLSRPSDIEYYTGFGFLLAEEREAYLAVSATKVVLWYASFSPLPDHVPCKAEPMRGLSSVVSWLAAQNTKVSKLKISIDPTNLNVAEYRLLDSNTHWELSDIDRTIIWQQRMVKDEAELAAITSASSLTEQVFATVKAELAEGMTEQKVASKIDQLIREAGGEPAFPTIVAFGANSALPHHQPTYVSLTKEVPILIDFGARTAGYCSDFTRTWWFGDKPHAEFAKIENIVHEAYEAGINVIRKRDESTTAASIDTAVRTVIKEAGYGEKFIHTTGHGLGLEIHEPPSVSSSNPMPLTTNMVITVEPGIYITGEFGYRFENTVLITDVAPIIMTESPS